LGVVVEGVWKFFGSTAALRGVSWRAGGRGLFLVLGPNGSGKTTLLRILCGVYRPSRGRVEVLGEDPWSSRTLYRRVAAYFDDVGLPWWLRGIDLLKVFASRLGVDWSDVVRVAEELGVTSYWSRRVWSYSSGMRKRLALVTVFSRSVDLYILDEPLTLLDREGRELVAKYLERLSREAMVIVASHIVADLAPLAREAMVLINGVKVFDTSERRDAPLRVVCSVDSREGASSIVDALLESGCRVVNVERSRVEAVCLGSAPRIDQCSYRIDVEEVYRLAMETSVGV